MCIRPDTLGVTSIVRAFGLKAASYDRLLDFFHSPAVKVAHLTSLWVRIVMNIFQGILTVSGRLLIVGDGLKVPKSGRKMPAVKRLHQASDSNTKPEYITGHSCQAVAVLARALQSVFAVPLASRIHEGVVFSNRDSKTLLDKMLLLVDCLGLPPFYFIADAYYSARKIMAGLLQLRKKACLGSTFFTLPSSVNCLSLNGCSINKSHFNKTSISSSENPNCLKIRST